MSRVEFHKLELPAPPQWLDQSQLSAALASVPGQVSEAGRRVAYAQYTLAEAKAHRDREESFVYQAARIALQGQCGKDSKGQEKDPTEAQVKAHMRTDPELWQRLHRAVMEAELSEARYETARSDYRAVCLEADMVLESCRNARAEMANLDPAVRFGQIGRSYPSSAAAPPAATLPLLDGREPPKFKGHTASVESDDSGLV